MAAVVRREGRLLLCQRPRHKRHGGLWEFPGGKVHPGETLGEALRRELDEELGLSLERILGHMGLHADPGSAFAIHFIAAETSGETALHEHEAVAWFAEAEAAALPLAPGDRAFVETLTAGRG